LQQTQKQALLQELAGQKLQQLQLNPRSPKRCLDSGLTTM
jgi:hypothetical protein